ncbi:MAG: BMP family ABC transporter substrate-binding protein [Sphaerochaeta sp.]|jgi:basic membrane protein A|uniref:BMP family ABC transporter substrate-binding protein n=2 Tax=root TaxID=1 RepID=A0ABY4DD51_9SPIR|nr:MULTISPECIES: BMP family ABC transporter substrate-binding protein [Sphaerochaeta]NLA99039.1 BMP family ABC transporter substrate-binding protein [Spirochaetales bacterium]MDD4037292.1 BMP family ABC transporter substrate-binding protein [Sphaerochaeta sp.]MDX9983041.1 BMP family ABC transporter substrate-binding protein [Sphaerochaeta sp.]UOM52187.1 BMP family ABC transporter substrate-binding protein [Sphaerochaeta associata]SMP46227.1 basic membrane protein A [Sphaerochaeta associata]
MKKLTILVLVLAMATMLFAQGGKEAAASDGRPTIRLLTDATGIDDKSFNAAAWRGIVEYYGDTVEKPANRGKLYDVVTAQTQDMYIPNLRQASDEGYDLIMVTGFTWADALSEVAPQYPDQKYTIVDVDWVGQPNVMEFIYSEEQGSFLVGLAAALQAKEDGIQNPRFGFIGGVPGATITKFEMGYVQGIRSVFPNAQIYDYYANDWGKPELAKAQAKNWYDMGVYCIFSAAGGTGNGTIAQAKEYRNQGKNVWAIGVDSDQYADGIYTGTKSAVLTSMLKRVENSSLMVLKAVADGSFSGGVVQMGMADDGVGYSTANPELSANVVKLVDAAKADINSGKIKIFKTYREALAAGAAPAGLAALDD